jgi:hypothetical protein
MDALHTPMPITSPYFSITLYSFSIPLVKAQFQQSIVGIFMQCYKREAFLERKVP